MTAKKLHFVIPLRIYPFEVVVNMGYSNDEIKYLLEKEGWLQTEISDAYLTHSLEEGKTMLTENNRAIIRLKYIPISAKDYGTLNHEISHMVAFILDRIGMEFKIGVSDEAYAYLTGFITEEIFKKLKVK